ncbi:MAG: amidohydrolase family protein [Candidatus Latescibacteria bacterium]|nr:amidohydrolase family protein [Candidatus Latescibacterota bacterium]
MRIAGEKKDRPASGIRHPKWVEALRRFRIVDAHVHNWGLFSEADDLAWYLDRFGLHAVALLSDLRGDGAPDPARIEASNEATARVRDRIGNRIIPFCYVNAMHTDHAVQEVDRWDAEGFRGLKLWISEHATDPRTYTVVEAALEKDWPIYYHSYYRPHGAAPHSESPPMEVAELARRYPEGRFIMAHMGAQFEHGLNAVADCPNVVVDYAGTVNEKGAYETALRLLGPDRIVFGTDMPACFYTNAGRVLELEASDAVKQEIFADNFLRLLEKPIGS